MRFLAALILNAVLACAQGPVLTASAGAHAVVPRDATTATRFSVLVRGADGLPCKAIPVTFRLPAEGPSGFFSSGMSSETVLTDERGEAAVFGIRWNDISGAGAIRATAKGSLVLLIPYEISATMPKPKEVSLGKHSSSGKKWWILTAVAGGALASLAVIPRSSPSGPTATPSAIVTPPSIGLPTITVGSPK